MLCSQHILFQTDNTVDRSDFFTQAMGGGGTGSRGLNQLGREQTIYGASIMRSTKHLTVVHTAGVGNVEHLSVCHMEYLRMIELADRLTG